MESNEDRNILIGYIFCDRETRGISCVWINSEKGCFMGKESDTDRKALFARDEENYLWCFMNDEWVQVNTIEQNYWDSSYCLSLECKKNSVQFKATIFENGEIIPIGRYTRPVFVLDSYWDYPVVRICEGEEQETDSEDDTKDEERPLMKFVKVHSGCNPPFFPGRKELLTKK